jgi:hypothetical protein
MYSIDLTASGLLLITGDSCRLPRHILKNLRLNSVDLFLSLFKNSRMYSVDISASSYPEKFKDVFR